MLGGERDRRVEVGLPLGERLAGHGEDEVEAHVRRSPARARRVDRGAGCRPASWSRPSVRQERRRGTTARRARAGSRPRRGSRRGAPARRVPGFASSVTSASGARPNARAAGVEHVGDRSGRRRATACRRRGRRCGAAARATGRRAAYAASSARDARDVRAVSGAFGGGVDVEVAVRADVPAPRHVHVERERLGRRAPGGHGSDGGGRRRRRGPPRPPRARRWARAARSRARGGRARARDRAS